jgi:amidase
VMLCEFKSGVDTYLGSRRGLQVRSLAEVIAFNEIHADAELCWFGQEILQEAQARGGQSDPAYLRARQRSRWLGREGGIDAALRRWGLDALVAPGGGPAGSIDLLHGDHGAGPPSSLSARAGYPLLSVPAGFVHGLPINILFLGTAYSEPVLLRAGYAFEQATRARRAPALAPTLPPPEGGGPYART